VGFPALLKHHWCMACSEDAYLHHGKIRVHSAAFMQAAVQSANQLSGQHGACRAGKSLCTYCAFSCSCIAKCTYCSSHLCHSQCAGRTPKQRDMSAAVVRDETNRQSGLGKTTFATLSTPEGYECVVIACMRQPHLCTVSVEQHMQGPGLALVDSAVGISCQINFDADDNSGRCCSKTCFLHLLLGRGFTHILL